MSAHTGHTHSHLCTNHTYSYTHADCTHSYLHIDQAHSCLHTYHNTHMCTYRSHMFINAHTDHIHPYLHTQITCVCVFLHRCTHRCSSPKDMYICPALFLVGTSWSWGSSLTPPEIVPQATNICWGLLFANWASQTWNFFFFLHLQASDHKSQKLVIFLWPFSYACCLLWLFRWKLNPHCQLFSWLVEPGSKRAVTLTRCLS